MSTDEEWEKWGKTDPYFGVITNEKYRNKNLSDSAISEFFQSGQEHIDHVLSMCRRHIDESFSPDRALDFGCGTGRLVIPLSEVSNTVVGLDVSDSMLDEAQKNCEKYSVDNVTLLKSDDSLSSLSGKFDFIHSFIVFQHIPTERGKDIFTKLISHLNDNGICAIQFTYSKSFYAENIGLPPEFPKLMLYKRVIRFIKKVIRVLKRKIKAFGAQQQGKDQPVMEMNPYNVNQILFIIQSLGAHKVHLEYTDHRGELGCVFYFQKPSSEN